MSTSRRTLPPSASPRLGTSTNSPTKSQVSGSRTESSGSEQHNELSRKLEALLVSPQEDQSQFSVAKYLNMALSKEALEFAGKDDFQHLQQAKMAELALHLQLDSQKCHNIIEQIGMDLNAMMPRCDSDASRIKVGLSALKQDALQLHKEAQCFVITKTNVQDKESETCVISPSSPPLELLTTLHALKKNLALTKSILSAASSWDATVSMIPSLLSPPSDGNTSLANLTEAVQALSSLEHGARALRGLPGVDERDSILSAVRSKIELLLRPKLLHALQQSKTASSSSNSASLGALQQVANMYKTLGKVDMLQAEYVKARPAAIQKAWFSYKGNVRNIAITSSKPLTNPESGTFEEADLRFIEDTKEGESFVTWTQEWYDSILNLLSEERRRTTAVFGPEDSPDVTAKILSECFRPLLLSFCNRLVSLYPFEEKLLQSFSLNDNQSTSTTQPELFEAVCAVYESTLRFLSMAYDANLQGLSLKRVRSIFSTVASPFAPYMEHCARLEKFYTKHHNPSYTTLVQSIQGIGEFGRKLIGSPDKGNFLTYVLQKSADQMLKLSIGVYPLVEGKF